MIKHTLTVVLVGLGCLFSTKLLSAQNVPQDKRVSHLASRILERLPDRPYTRPALGKGDSRPWRSLAHARAIVKAADANKSKWEELNLPHFSPEYDLAPLIAAVTFRESSFRNVVRLDGGKIVGYVPMDPVRKKIERADIGVMQVRAPSRPAYNCGVTKSSDVQRLLTDLDYSYGVGACILSNRFRKSSEKYRSRDMRRLRINDRPKKELLFYGVYGPRRDSQEAARARGLLPLERYNWGGKDLYMHEPNSGYARRVIEEYEFFRDGLETILDS